MDDSLVSRQAAIDALDEQIELCNKALGSFDISTKDEYAIKVERASLKVYREQLENLPSTQFERKIGQWIFEERKRLVDETDDGAVYRTEKWWSCSECGYTKGYHISKPSSNYCENCGAEMLKEGKE